MCVAPVTFLRHGSCDIVVLYTSSMQTFAAYTHAHLEQLAVRAPYMTMPQPETMTLRSQASRSRHLYEDWPSLGRLGSKAAGLRSLSRLRESWWWAFVGVLLAA